MLNFADDISLSVSSLMVTDVPEFELIENKGMEKIIRAMYEETSDLLILSKQTVHTPFELCWEILENMNISADKKFLVISALEFVVVLMDVFKVSKHNIFFLDEGMKDGTNFSIKMDACEKLGLPQHQILTIEGMLEMKFDFIVGNPPFSITNPGKTSGKRSVVLYPEFYRKAVLNSDCVAMVMPDTSNYAASAHNDFLLSSKAKAYPISQEMHDTMGIIIKTWYVIHYKGDNTPSNIVFTTNLENANDLPIQKGRVNLSTTEHVSEQNEVYSVPVVKGMTRKGMELRFIKESDAKFKLTDDKFAVVFPLCVQPHGWSHCEIVTGYGQCFNINTFYIVADTLDDAKKFKELICSESFISQANQLKGNSGTMGLEKFKKIKI